MARILAIRWQPALLALALVAGGCAEEPLPEQGIRRGDCLQDLSLANLEERLQECHAVVKAFPEDPAPLNDRYLLHSLLGNDQAACGDLRKAVELARAIPASQVDEQLRTDLQVRKQLCKADEPGSPVAQ